MKRALVISGGGSKGAYAIGVLKRLLEAYPGLNFDLYVGTSTGALIAPLAAIDEIDLLASLYTSLHTEDVVLANRVGDVLNEVGIFDVEPLRQLLLTHYDDQRYQQLSTAGKEVFLTTTCLQSGELVVFTNATDPAKSALYQTRKIESTMWKSNSPRPSSGTCCSATPTGSRPAATALLTKLRGAARTATFPWSGCHRNTTRKAR